MLIRCVLVAEQPLRHRKCLSVKKLEMYSSLIDSETREIFWAPFFVLWDCNPVRMEWWHELDLLEDSLEQRKIIMKKPLLNLWRELLIQYVNFSICQNWALFERYWSKSVLSTKVPDRLTDCWYKYVCMPFSRIWGRQHVLLCYAHAPRIWKSGSHYLICFWKFYFYCIAPAPERNIGRHFNYQTGRWCFNDQMLVSNYVELHQNDAHSPTRTTE